MSDEEGLERAGARGSVVAVAEVSLQVPNGRTAPPIPLPLWVKRVSGGWAPREGRSNTVQQ